MLTKLKAGSEYMLVKDGASLEVQILSTHGRLLNRTYKTVPLYEFNVIYYEGLLPRYGEISPVHVFSLEVDSDFMGFKAGSEIVGKFLPQNLGEIDLSFLKPYC